MIQIERKVNYLMYLQNKSVHAKSHGIDDVIIYQHT